MVWNDNTEKILYMEGFFILYSISTLFWIDKLFILPPEFITLNVVKQTLITFPIFVLLIIVISLKKLRITDTRFKILMQFFIFVFPMRLLSILLPIIQINSLKDQILMFLLLILPLIILAIIYISILIRTYDPLLEQANILSQQILHENYDFYYDAEIIQKDRVLGTILDTFNDIMIILNRKIKELSVISESVINNSEQLSSGTEELQAVTEEVSATAQSMSEGAAQQAEIISELNAEVSKIGLIITELSGSIKSNIKSVEELALQTNILAMNAGIEASRAGDYGRGFAVVADNIRKLSVESKQLAEQITTVVNNMIDKLSENFNTISDGVGGALSVSEETAASSEEIAASMEEVNATIEELNMISSDLVSMVTQ